MVDNTTFLGLIPARGGSKRIPKKNMMECAGKPLIAWSIEAGLQSKHLDALWVSTDDTAIAAYAQSIGATVPFIRPPELATDTATSIDVIVHAIHHAHTTLHTSFDYIVLLQPTSPLRDHADIDHAIRFCMDKKADAVISVCKADHSPLWMNTLPNDLSMTHFLRTSTTRSQDLEQYYHLNGALYICKTDKLICEHTLFLKENIFAYIMPQHKSIDIDTHLDFRLAEYYLTHQDTCSETLEKT